MKKLKVTVNVDPKLKQAIKACADAFGYKSESEFCAEGLEFYVGYMLHENNKDYIDRVMVQAVDATVEKHADRISDALFKLAVGLEKQTLGERYNYDDGDELEMDAINNVKRRQGRL